MSSTVPARTGSAPQPRLSDEARALVEEHLPLVRQVLAGVAAHYPRHADREELASAAALGLVEAASRYDKTLAVPFARWASVRIRGAIVDAVRGLDFAPRSLRSAARQVESAQAQLESRLGRPADEAETARALGITPAELASLKGRVHTSLVLSLDAPGGTDGDDAGAALGAAVIDVAQLQPVELLEQREQQRYLHDALACLPDRLREVVQGYFLEGRSSADIAARLGVTESRVSQMRTDALKLMRAGLEAQYAEPHRARRAAAPAPRAGAYAAAVASRSSFLARLAPEPPQRQVRAV